MKTETVAKYLAKGKVINVLEPKAAPKKQLVKRFRKDTQEVVLDINSLPMALRIRYGLK